MRLTKGVNLAALSRKYGRDTIAAFRSRIDTLVDEGLLEKDGSWLRLSSRGRLMSNEVFGRFIAAGGVMEPERNLISVI